MSKTLRACAVLALACGALLSGCGGNSSTTPVLGPDGQPTGQVVQQDQGHPFLAALGGSFLGNMLGNHFSRPPVASPGYAGASGPSHVVVNKTVINKTIVNKTIVKPPVVTTSPSVQPPKPQVSRPSSSYSSRSSSRSSSYSSPSRSSYSSSRGGRR